MASPSLESQASGAERVSRRRRGSTWDALLYAHDALTIAFSVSDIVLDILVTIKFAQDGHVGFFIASCCIFAVAQASYALIFTSSFASHLSDGKRLLVFLAALPLAQLIPLFSWVESLHWPSLALAMRAIGLQPSAQVCPASGDSLWLVFRAKFAAHSGFLAEAVLEAVPQCVLQTAHIMWTGATRHPPATLPWTRPLDTSLGHAPWTRARRLLPARHHLHLPLSHRHRDQGVRPRTPSLLTLHTPCPHLGRTLSRTLSRTLGYSSAAPPLHLG